MPGLKKGWCILVLLLFPAASLFAQLSPTITLKQLLHLVGQKVPVLLTDSSAILIRQVEATEIRSDRLPNLRLNYQADIGINNNVASPYFGYGIIPSNSRGVRDQSNTTAATVNLGIAAFDWEVYNFGAYGAQNKVARSAIGVEQNQFAQSKYQLQSFAISNYLQLLRLQDYLNIRSRNIVRNQEINRSIRSLAVSGVRPGVDTSIAKAELSKARLNYIGLDNQLKQVQLQLSAISGLIYQTIVPDTSAEQKLISQATAVPTLNTDTSNHPLIKYYRSVYQNNLLKEALVKKQSKLPEMQNLLPDDVKISYEFDQSVFVVNAVKSLITEGTLGAILTGLMVLLFLRDWRSSLIVVITIPISILIGVLLLSLFGQTINIMTLSGLALAIGILVDQATVTIENIHQHLEIGKNKRRAIYGACE